jgi:cobalt-zinc-cadmium efflux system protein
MSVLKHGEGEAERDILHGLKLAVLFSAIILGIEAVGAFAAHSLSLTVDAVHNIPDIIAFAISWGALQATGAGADEHFTFGAHRFEVFASILNATLVLGAGLVFGYEALASLLLGPPVAGSVDAIWILAAAVPVLALRAVNLAILGRLPRRVRDLNLSSVLVHLASDLVITVALLVAGALLLLQPAWTWADPGAALIIAAVLVYESLPFFRDGWEVLSEKTPRSLSMDQIRETVLGVPGVAEVHDIHVWAVCSSLVCMTAHVGVADMPLTESMRVSTELRRRMEAEYGIVHATFEVEAVPVGAPGARPSGGDLPHSRERAS